MKKLICLAIAMVFCFTAVAMAEYEPSKSTADMAAVITFRPTNGVEVKNDFEVTLQGGELQVALCDEIVAKLAKAEEEGKLAEFYSDLKDKSGADVSLEEMLGTDSIAVNEVVPLVCENYDDAYETMKVSFAFSTPYEEDQTVIVVVLIPDPETGALKKIALKGVGNSEKGIDVEFPPEVLKAIENGTATMTIINK